MSVNAAGTLLILSALIGIIGALVHDETRHKMTGAIVFGAGLGSALSWAIVTVWVSHL